MLTERRIVPSQEHVINPTSNILATVSALGLRDNLNSNDGAPIWPTSGLPLQVNSGGRVEHIFNSTNREAAFRNSLRNLVVNLDSYRGNSETILQTYRTTRQLPSELQAQVGTFGPNASIAANRVQSFIGNWRSLQFFHENVDIDHDNILENHELNQYEALRPGETTASPSYNSRHASVQNAQTVFPSLLLFVRFSNSDTQVVDQRERVDTLESSVSGWQWATAGSLFVLGLTAFFMGRGIGRAREQGAADMRRDMLRRIGETEITDPDLVEAVRPHIDRAVNLQTDTADVARNQGITVGLEQARTRLIDRQRTNEVDINTLSTSTDPADVARREELERENAVIPSLVRRISAPTDTTVGSGIGTTASAVRANAAAQPAVPAAIAPAVPRRQATPPPTPPVRRP